MGSLRKRVRKGGIAVRMIHRRGSAPDAVERDIVRFREAAMGCAAASGPECAVVAVGLPMEEGDTAGSAVAMADHSWMV